MGPAKFEYLGCMIPPPGAGVSVYELLSIYLFCYTFERRLEFPLNRDLPCALPPPLEVVATHVAHVALVVQRLHATLLWV